MADNDTDQVAACLAAWRTVTWDPPTGLTSVSGRAVLDRHGDYYGSVLTERCGKAAQP